MRIFKIRQQLQRFITTCADPELRSLLQQRLHELADYQLHEVGYFYIVEGAAASKMSCSHRHVKDHFVSFSDKDDGFCGHPVSSAQMHRAQATFRLPHLS